MGSMMRRLRRNMEKRGLYESPKRRRRRKRVQAAALAGRIDRERKREAARRPPKKLGLLGRVKNFFNRRQGR